MELRGKKILPGEGEKTILGIEKDGDELAISFSVGDPICNCFNT